MLNRTPARIATSALGVGYIGCATVNALVTLRTDPSDVYWPGGLGDTTWLAPYRWVEEHLIAPNGTAFTLALVTFQVLLGAHLLMAGRRAEEGLLVATAFVLVLVPALAFPYWIVNVALAGLQVYLRRVLRSERLDGAAVGRLRHAS